MTDAETPWDGKVAISTRAQREGRKRTYHTRECSAFPAEENIRTVDPVALPDHWKECERCNNKGLPPHGATGDQWAAKLARADPEDYGLSAIGERKRANE